MLITFPLMPDPGYFKSYLAFDFGAKSGRTFGGTFACHLPDGFIATPGAIRR